MMSKRRNARSISTLQISCSSYTYKARWSAMSMLPLTGTRLARDLQHIVDRQSFGRLCRKEQAPISSDQPCVHASSALKRLSVPRSHFSLAAANIFPSKHKTCVSGKQNSHTSENTRPWKWISLKTQKIRPWKQFSLQTHASQNTDFAQKMLPWNTYSLTTKSMRHRIQIFLKRCFLEIQFLSRHKICVPEDRYPGRHKTSFPEDTKMLPWGHRTCFPECMLLWKNKTCCLKKKHPWKQNKLPWELLPWKTCLHANMFRMKLKDASIIHAHMWVAF